MLYEFYKNIDNSDKYEIYKYLAILVLFIWLSKLVSINLSILLGLMIAIFIIFYMDYKKQDEIKENTDIIKQKYDSIRPHMETVGEFDDIINLLYSVQEMYIYNPQAYEEVVDNINEFLEIYKQSKMFPELAGSNYPLADKAHCNAINAIHSIIYNLPPNKFFINKLERAVENLDTILSTYLSEIYEINNIQNKSYGYNANSVVINKGPRAINFYENKSYTFDIFS